MRLISLSQLYTLGLAAIIFRIALLQAGSAVVINVVLLLFIIMFINQCRDFIFKLFDVFSVFSTFKIKFGLQKILYLLFIVAMVISISSIFSITNEGGRHFTRDSLTQDILHQ